MVEGGEGCWTAGRGKVPLELLRVRVGEVKVEVVSIDEGRRRREGRENDGDKDGDDGEVGRSGWCIVRWGRT